MLKVENLSKTFIDSKGDELKAVNELSFSCATGEIVGILGMNGAGKSTTLRMLSTVLHPTSGTASLGDINIIDHPEDVRKNIGFLSGSTGLYKKLTAKETLLYFAQLHGMKKQETLQKISELSQLLDMDDFLDRTCEKLSTGQKQKVNICRTIIHDPDLLILDEATTGLDVVAKQSIINFIHHFSSKAILFCTHHMDEVYQLCDKVLLLNKGQRLAFGTIEEVCQEFDAKDLNEVFARYADKMTQSSSVVS